MEPTTSSAPATVGEKVTTFGRQFELPVGALLLGPDGVTYRVIEKYGEKQIEIGPKQGGVYFEKFELGDVHPEKEFDNGYTLTVVWLP